jgi:subtilisin-like proprotein convertase family protein
VSPAAATICLTTPKSLQQLQITSALAGSTTTVYSSGTVNLAVPDNIGTPTLSNINVTLPAGAVVSDYSVTLNMSHTYPGDMIFNLKAPNGTIANLYKYNNGNGTGASSGVATWGWYNAQINTVGAAFSTVTAAPFIYKTPPTVFKPDLLNTDVTGVGFPFNNPTGYNSTATNLSQLLTTDPAGTWTLAMADGGPGDLGTLASWSLSFTYSAPTQGIWSVAGSPGVYTGLYTDATGGTAYTGAPANIVYASPLVTTTYQVTVANPVGGCISQPRTVVVTVNTPITITTQPTNQSVCTDKAVSFTTVATGSAITHNWQVSTANGTPGSWVNITNGGVYSGANTGTLTITAPPVSMNGYLYRDSISTTPCAGKISNNVRLTVNPLPTVTLTANPRALMPGVTTTITGSSTPSIVSYQWIKDGTVVSSGTLGTPSPQITYNVDVDGIGTYKLRVTDVNGCVNTSAGLLISDSSSGRVFITPTPNTGRFTVRYHTDLNNTALARGVNIYDDKGARVYTQRYTINAPYAPMAVDMRKFGTGTYWVEVVDVNGNRLAMGRTIILR